MASAPLRRCSKAGCQALSREGRCAEHRGNRESKRCYDKQRGTAASRGYGSKWQKYSEAYRRQHPLCVECMKEGRTKAAECVDHIVPHRGDQQLFWDPSNHQSLCWSHHSAKTRRGE